MNLRAGDLAVIAVMVIGFWVTVVLLINFIVRDNRTRRR